MGACLARLSPRVCGFRGHLGQVFIVKLAANLQPPCVSNLAYILGMSRYSRR